MLLFMKVLFTQFIAEMGDKTQLMLVAMTSRFKLKDILLGTGSACRRYYQYRGPYLADPSDRRCSVPVFCGDNVEG